MSIILGARMAGKTTLLGESIKEELSKDKKGLCVILCRDDKKMTQTKRVISNILEDNGLDPNRVIYTDPVTESEAICCHRMATS